FRAGSLLCAPNWRDKEGDLLPPAKRHAHATTAKTFGTNNDAPHLDNFPWCPRPCDRHRRACAGPADRALRHKRARSSPTQPARKEQAQGGEERATTRGKEGPAPGTTGQSHGAAGPSKRCTSWNTASQERHRPTRQGGPDPEGAAGLPGPARAASESH